MSNRREQLSEKSESAAVMAWLTKYYHYPVLFILVAFAFWNRIRNWSNFVIDGTIFFRGNDAYYHFRATEYAVNNNLGTQPFDPWTYFPFGTFPAQFGTIFDQLIGFVALVVGLGNPSESLLRYVFLLSPPFFAVALCVPAYIIGRRLGGRFGGLVSVSFIAFAADRLLQVSVAGFVDHHIAEALFMSLAVLGMMVALTVAQKDKPVYELVAAREFDPLRRTIGWSLLAGIAIGMYLWTWPPGVYLYGVLGAFFVLQMSVEHMHGRSPEHVAFVGVISLTTAGLLQLATVRSFGLSATGRSLLQPGFAFLVAGGVIFLAWLSREVESRSQPRYVYPLAIAGSIIASVGLVALLLPDLFDFFFTQVNRVLNFVSPPTETAGTVGEAQPLDPSQLYQFYKLGIYTAAAGAVLILGKQLFPDRAKAQELLIVVWSGFILASTLTQLRFSYYITIAVGALNAVLVGFVIDMTGTSDRELNIETYQVLAVTAVLMLIVMPMLIVSPIMTTAADRSSNPGGIQGWDDSLDWMNENTPAEGQFANPDGDPLEYLGTFDQTDDYNYQNGTYGVLSWWDYGHWITTEAERMPTANPFQQGTDTAASFLLSQNQSEAEGVLEGLQDSESAATRYVMVDWHMVEADSIIGGKFFAPFAFNDEYEQSNFYTRLGGFTQQGGFRTAAILHQQPYYESMAVRLYEFHGSSQEPAPVVVRTQGAERDLGNGETYQQPGGGQGQPIVEYYNSTSEAQQEVQDNPNARLGGIGPYPSERVPALENYRLVHMDNVSALGSGAKARQVQRTLQATGLRSQLEAQNIPPFGFMFDNTPSWTKTFERVEGATIEGTGPENATISLSAQMNPENGAEFEYTQQVQTGENGEFTTTVPYSTTGYEEWGVDEGYTNVSVRATGPYTLRTGITQNEDGNLAVYSGEVNVTEGQVIGENSSAATVDLEEQVLQQPENQSEDGSSEDGDQTQDGGQDSETTETQNALHPTERVTDPVTANS